MKRIPLFIPNSQSLPYLFLRPIFGKKIFLPYFSNPVAAGFPSPADGFLDKALDLNEFLISNKFSTFFVRVAGDSMQGCGIYDNTLLVIDRSVKATDGRVVLAVINGEFTCKRIRGRVSGKGQLEKKENLPSGGKRELS